MTFISPEEAIQITKTENEAKRKRGKPSKPSVDPVLGSLLFQRNHRIDEVKPEWKKAKKDIREIATVLAFSKLCKRKANPRCWPSDYSNDGGILSRVS